MVLRNGQLDVRRLEGSKNPIRFNGQGSDEFSIEPGQSFTIGKTTFRLVARQAGEAAPPDPVDSAAALKSIGKFSIKKELGSGGMGTVYLAQDTQLERPVALKVLALEKAEEPTSVRRFQSEAQSAAQLKHPNIVETYEAGKADGYWYIAQEFVEGIDLEEYLKRNGKLAVKRTLSVIKQVVLALQHAHQRGIVHRDIKPSNLLIRRDGVVKLTDMGLARSVANASDSGSLTDTGIVVGTVDYMSPEQAELSRSADIRSDIYSLGCAWYAMLTGKPPYPEGNLTEKLVAHATSPPPDPRDEDVDVPATWVVLLHRMMAKSADERYQTPTELLEDLSSDMLTKEEVSSNLLAALADEDTDAAATRKRPQKRPRGVAVQCEHCGRSYKVRMQLAGKRVKCKQCGRPIPVPG